MKANYHHINILLKIIKDRLEINDKWKTDEFYLCTSFEIHIEKTKDKTDIDENKSDKIDSECSESIIYDEKMAHGR
jgi:hypothetical protein